MAAAVPASLYTLVVAPALLTDLSSEFNAKELAVLDSNKAAMEALLTKTFIEHATASGYFNRHIFKNTRSVTIGAPNKDAKGGFRCEILFFIANEHGIKEPYTRHRRLLKEDAVELMEALPGTAERVVQSWLKVFRGVYQKITDVISPFKNIAVWAQGTVFLETKQIEQYNHFFSLDWEPSPTADFDKIIDELRQKEITDWQSSKRSQIEPFVLFNLKKLTIKLVMLPILDVIPIGENYLLNCGLPILKAGESESPHYVIDALR